MRHKELNLKKLLSSSYTYSFIAKGSHIIIGFISMIIINRYLGAELRGEFAYIMNVLSILVIIGNLGIYQTYPYNKRKKIDDICSYYVNLIVMQFSLYLLVGLAINLIYAIDGFGNANILLLITFLLLLTNVFSSQITMITAVEYFKFKSIFMIVSEFIKFVLLLIMFLVSERNLTILLLINVVYHIVLSIFCLAKLKVKIKFTGYNLSLAKNIIRQGFVPMLFTLLLSLNYRIDVLFLKHSDNVTLEQLGLYSVGLQIAAYVWVFPDIFKEVLFSKTARDDSLQDISFSMKFSFLLEFIILFFILLYGEDILVLLYGSEFRDAVAVTQIIFIGVISMTLFKLLTPLYNAKGKFVGNFLILLSSVLLNVIFNILLVPKYGIEGAAIATVIGYTICGGIYLTRFKKDYQIPLNKLILINKHDVLFLKRFLFKDYQKM